MNILFLSLGKYRSLKECGLYGDLLKNLASDGHEIFVVSPIERREKAHTTLVDENNLHFLSVRTLNIQKTNLFEKGIGTLTLPSRFMKGIKKYFKHVKFDLVIYPTPPITIYSVVKRIKRHSKARTYLLLKDIFPQNAVDLGIFKKNGIFDKFFKKTEKKLYLISDRIGCMSQANVDYLLAHNNFLDSSKIEILPNCINPITIYTDEKEKELIRTEYNLPLNKKIFVYGGNLGRPQDIPFVISCIDKCKTLTNVHFLIVGSGTDKQKIIDYINLSKPNNLSFVDYVPQNQYLKLISACDVGLIFLDYRFTIPNYPSRFLSYLQVGLPILACTDLATDIGKDIENSQIGWWIPSNDSDIFFRKVQSICDDSISYRNKTFNLLDEKFNCNKEYKKVLRN